MNLSDLTTLFGSGTPWIVSAIGIFLSGVTICAFHQGRTISFWPPQIGPRLGGRLPSPYEEAEADREYTVDRAKDFYQEIAANYDLRNSGKLVATHLATVAQLQMMRARRPKLRVLDLGGGTGKLIAIHFFNDEAVSWTYVDSCSAMAGEFRRNLAGYVLGRNSTVIVDDLDEVVQQLEPASYDVVVLSMVLSSMRGLPDFTAIARLLSSDGSLIVSDINPNYTHAHPLYKVPVYGAVVALRTTPVDPFEVLRRATAAGLRTTEQRTLGEGSTYYSFMTIFTPETARPTNEQLDDKNLVRG